MLVRKESRMSRTNVQRISLLELICMALIWVFAVVYILAVPTQGQEETSPPEQDGSSQISEDPLPTFSDLILEIEGLDIPESEQALLIETLQQAIEQETLSLSEAFQLLNNVEDILDLALIDSDEANSLAEAILGLTNDGISIAEAAEIQEQLLDTLRNLTVSVEEKDNLRQLLLQGIAQQSLSSAEAFTLLNDLEQLETLTPDFIAAISQETLSLEEALALLEAAQFGTGSISSVSEDTLKLILDGLSGSEFKSFDEILALFEEFPDPNILLFELKQQFDLLASPQGIINVISNAVTKAGYGDVSSAKMLNKADDLIANGVPPGIVVRMIKQALRGSYSEEQILAELDTLNEAIESGTSPGQAANQTQSDSSGNSSSSNNGKGSENANSNSSKNNSGANSNSSEESDDSPGNSANGKSNAENNGKGNANGKNK